MSPDSKEILHNSVYRREPLHVGGRREAPHLALPVTRRLVGDLGSIVRVLISDVDRRRRHGAARGGVGAQLVGDQSSRNTALGFQQLPKESDGCSPIPVRLHEDVQDVTVLVYRAPQILVATLDRDEHLVEMPGVSHPTAAAPQPPRVDRTEPLAPLPNRLVGDRHASLREEIFSIAEAEAEPIVEPDRVADNIGWDIDIRDSWPTGSSSAYSATRRLNLTIL